MADVGYIALAVAGLGAYWWRVVRSMQIRHRDVFEPDAEVAVHVALHEAEARRQSLTSLHVLYGLLQDEAVATAVQATGADPDQLIDRVLDALALIRDPNADGEPQASLGAVKGFAPLDGADVIDHGAVLTSHAIEAARHRGRRASCTDLWAALVDSPAGRLLRDNAIEHNDVLFRLFHGSGEPPLPIADELDVLIVLRNDDYTTQHFVCSVLHEVFGLAYPQAAQIMLATHEAGRAVVGRFTAAAARAKIAEARARARASAYPLWIGVEPA